MSYKLPAHAVHETTACPQKRPLKYNGVVFEILGKHY